MATCPAFLRTPVRTESGWSEEEECGKETVVSLPGLASFGNVPFCAEHAEAYVQHLREMYETEPQGPLYQYNRDTLYCKWQVAKKDLEKWKKGLSDAVQR